jgi:general L-amino acid transport system permease protein
MASRARPWAALGARSAIAQALVLAGVALLVWWLVANTGRNLAAHHIATGFAFLRQTAPIPIGETLIPYTPSVSTYGRALLVGILNTLKVAVAGCVLATCLGTLIGIGRLSRNWLVAKLTAAYVEVVRDTPLLLQLFFWYALLQTLPPPRQALHPLAGVFLSNRGIELPFPDWHPAYAWVLATCGLGVAGVVGWARLAEHRRRSEGVRPPVWPAALLLPIGLPLAVWAALGAPFRLDLPALQKFNFAGGLTVTPEYAALLIGLVVYTAAYIAEIVRGGILGVPPGQWEAGAALALPRGLVLRRIVLPQALRLIIPPLTSPYLNLVKNSSLAVAIGYQEIVSIADTTLNQTGQAIEGIAIIMAVYLTISLSISLFMNWYNARIALRER